MVDRRRETAPCAAAQDLLVELALGVLTPEGCRRVDPHVAVCPSCAAEVADLRRVVDEVVAAAPSADPPPALLQRAVAAHAALHDGQGGSAEDGVAVARSSTAPPGASSVPEDPVVVLPGKDRSLRGRQRRWVAVAAAVALVAGALAGLAIGRGSAGPTATDAALERVGVAEVRSGPLVGPDGRTWGRVVVTGGSSPVLVMTLDRVRTGAGYGCAVRDQAGVLQPIGAWVPTHDDQRTWAADLPPAVAGTREVAVTGSDGRRLAVAHLS